MLTVRLFTDGGIAMPPGSGVHNNPGGWMSYGWVAKCNHKGRKSGRGILSPPYEGNTNNVAEYRALTQGLIGFGEWSKEWEPGKLLIFSDSKLIVNQVNGKYKVRSLSLRPWRLHVWVFLKMHQERGWKIRLEWIPRDNNRRADELSKLAFQESWLDRTEDNI